MPIRQLSYFRGQILGHVSSYFHLFTSSILGSQGPTVHVFIKAPFLTTQDVAGGKMGSYPQGVPSDFWIPSHKPNRKANEQLDEDRLEPIAVIGFSLTFPGDATSAGSFWSMLMEGRCVSTEWPKDRLNGSALYHPDPERLDSVC